MVWSVSSHQVLFASLVDLLADPEELLEVLAADQDLLAVDPEIAEVALGDSLVAALMLVDVVALGSGASDPSKNTAAAVVRAPCLAIVLLLHRLRVQYLRPDHDAILLRPGLGSCPLLPPSEELLPFFFCQLPPFFALLFPVSRSRAIHDQCLKPQLQDVVVLDVPVVVVCGGGASACLVLIA